MLRALLSLIVAIVVAVAVAPFVLDWAWAHAVRTVVNEPQDMWALVIGGVLGAVLVIWRAPSWFWHTWVHEHCHLVACLVLGVRVRAIAASDGKGGALDFDEVDPLRGVLIAIAPYTLPLVLLPLLLVQECFPPTPWRMAATGLCALAFMLHLQGLWHNIRINISGTDSDLVRVGRPLSLVLIVLALAGAVSATIAVLWSDPVRDGIAWIIGRF